MKIEINEDARINGLNAARQTAEYLRRAVGVNGEARLLLSTGASQFEMFEALVKADVPWDKIEMFHLDEYVALPYDHPASFRKYLTTRFVDRVPLKAAYLVDGENDIAKTINELSDKINEKPIDVGLIGIGENGHIAFNDPPADFETDAAYIVVDLDEKCKAQQVREGWFPDIGSVPKQAISMTVKQIMKCRHIISVVPHAVKADAVYKTLHGEINNTVPATILKSHKSWELYLDMDSASLIYKR
jgi:glucosamine-6-phosphate deaminase